MRKVIQTTFGDNSIIALCNDGSMWRLSQTAIWDKIPDIPQSDAKKKTPVKRFVVPTRSDVREYMESLGSVTETIRFCDFYESKNWYVGKNKMKDWRAAARNWVRRNETNSRSNGNLPAVSGRDKRSRAKRVSDKLDEIARRDIDQNGFADSLGQRTVQTPTG